MAQCRAPGCTADAARYSNFCRRHKAQARRHGAVGQEGITATALQPYVAMVRARIEKNRDNPAWPACEGRWEGVCEHAEALLAAYRAGQPGNRFEREAAESVVSLAAHVEPRAVVETVLAMYLLQEVAPHRFRSDDAFRVQLARRVRALGAMNVGTTYDHTTGRVKRVYREKSAKVTTRLASWLIEALGGAGLHVARLELADMQKKAEAQRSLADALASLK